MNRLMLRDERETSVDLAADRLAYLVLSFGLLAIVAYRGFVSHETSWDLLALIVLSGVVGAAYRLQHRVASWRWQFWLVATVGVAFAVAAIVVLLARS